MSGKAIDEIFIPAGFARAFIVKKNQLMRICQVEGKQTGDLAIFNANDLAEYFCVGQSLALNEAENIGTMKYITKFYSAFTRECFVYSN